MKSTYKKCVFLYVSLCAAGTFGLLISPDLAPRADASNGAPEPNPCSAVVQERLNAREAFSGLTGLIQGEEVDTRGITESIGSNLDSQIECATPQIQDPR
jgi:hypothetical protein